MVNYNYYSYGITWSVEDREFVGLCTEFSSLSYLDEDKSAALLGITALVQDVVAEMEATGEKVPEPIAEKVLAVNFKSECHQIFIVS